MRTTEQKADILWRKRNATSGGGSGGVDLTTATGVLATSKGGTGQTSYTDGQLLIGSTSGNTLAKATLTAGTGVTITNGPGTITISSSAGASSSIPDYIIQSYGVI